MVTSLEQVTLIGIIFMFCRAYKGQMTLCGWSDAANIITFVERAAKSGLASYKLTVM